ncbi:UDP-3-O-glucosamine N-acyltransferase [Gymnopilus junonius]|uniref:Translation initiation factor eIF2B subunit gamma n=1 Tax=Gymnopilus junonius TaxID=109634 RepID=A0A9P5NI78_GYMJU|nr:UDP-3-O-glucosamine N-acyltransferase [Gymnopilus junonius]
MDLDDVKSDLVTREFLAVVLAGFGNELVPLTSDYGDDPCPKALLPVANKPLLEYVLVWLEQSGIKDVLLICPSSHRSSIYHHIHSDVSSSSLRIDLQTYDESRDDNTGPCALLRHFSNRITEDFVVVPCDFIPPPTLPLSLLLNKFRVDALSEACLATTCFFSSRPFEKETHFEEWGSLPSVCPIIWDPSAGSLLHIDTPDDQDRNSDAIELKMSLLSRYPRTKLSSFLQDSHVYVCRRSVLDILHEKPHFSSLREEFLPWLCKIQYRQSKRVKYKKVLDSLSPPTTQILALSHSSNFVNTGGDSQAGMLSPGDSDTSRTLSSTRKIGLVIYDQNTEVPMRINTLHNFYEMNKRILSGTTYSLPVDPKDRSLIDQRAQISVDSIIGESTQISERSTIKRSIIGRHCIIGKLVKITGSILLDHCIVEDGTKLENCILGKSTRVGAKAELTKCVTQAGYEVSGGEVAKGEKLEVSDWMATPDTSIKQTSDLHED